MDSFENYLRTEDPKSDSIQQAARLCLAEFVDDLPVEEMQSRLESRIGKAELVKVLKTLEKDSWALENASLDILAAIWNRPSGIEKVRTTIDQSAESLPVIETGILAIVTMYFAYLAATGGVSLEEETVERLNDGTIRRTVRRTFYGPTGPLAAVGRILKIN